MRPPITVFALTVLLAIGASTAVVEAEGPPTADQIINSLLPRAGTSDVRRGISTAKPAAPPQSSPRGESGSVYTVPSAVTQPAVSGAPSVNLNILFRTDSAELTPAALLILDQLGRALSSQLLKPYRFRIEGHTDTVGSADYNKRLSERRAQAVADYVSKTYGVDRSRLESVGLGKEDLLVATPEQTPELRNRRVQVVNIDG